MELKQEINKLTFKLKRLEQEGSYEAFEWKIKYEESVSEIRKLKRQLEETEPVSSYNEWEYKYKELERKYRSLESDLEYYREEYERLNR